MNLMSSCGGTKETFHRGIRVYITAGENEQRALFGA